jgi:hypothetical protein
MTRICGVRSWMQRRARNASNWGQGVVGQDEVRRRGKLGQKVGLGRQLLPVRLEPCSPQPVQQQLHVGGRVFEDHDVER